MYVYFIQVVKKRLYIASFVSAADIWIAMNSRLVNKDDFQSRRFHKTLHMEKNW